MLIFVCCERNNHIHDLCKLVIGNYKALYNANIWMYVHWPTALWGISGNDRFVEHRLQCGCEAGEEVRGGGMMLYVVTMMCDDSYW